jgi:hypothetical protein
MTEKEELVRVCNSGRQAGIGYAYDYIIRIQEEGRILEVQGVYPHYPGCLSVKRCPRIGDTIEDLGLTPATLAGRWG